MKIVIHEDNTGFAPKHCRFHATEDDTYDGAEDSRNRSTIGYGATREEAIADLLEIMLDECEITDDEYRAALQAFGVRRLLDPDRLREDRQECLRELED